MERHKGWDLKSKGFTKDDKAITEEDSSEEKAKEETNPLEETKHDEEYYEKRFKAYTKEKGGFYNEQIQSKKPDYFR